MYRNIRIKTEKNIWYLQTCPKTPCRWPSQFHAPLWPPTAQVLHPGNLAAHGWGPRPHCPAEKRYPATKGSKPGGFYSGFTISYKCKSNIPIYSIPMIFTWYSHLCWLKMLFCLSTDLVKIWSIRVRCFFSICLMWFNHVLSH